MLIEIKGGQVPKLNTNKSVAKKKKSESTKTDVVGNLAVFNKALAELLKAGLAIERLYDLAKKAAESEIGQAVLKNIFDAITMGFKSLITTHGKMKVKDLSGSDGLKAVQTALDAYWRYITVAQEVVNLGYKIDQDVQGLSKADRGIYTEVLVEYILNLLNEHSLDAVRGGVERGVLMAYLTVSLPEGRRRRVRTI